MNMKKGLFSIMALALCLVASPIQSKAANGVEIDAGEVNVPYMSTNTVSVSYTGSFSDLVVVVADGSKAGAVLSDLGNGKANLVFSSFDFGRTTAAVYKASNMSAIDYIIVDSGLTKGNNIQNYINGSKITTVYSDCVVKYDAILRGANGAEAANTGLILERNDGMNELKVTANIIKEDSTLTGLSTFYADYFDAANQLIKTQKVYVRSNLGVPCNISWYIPKECVTIVLK